MGDVTSGKGQTIMADKQDFGYEQTLIYGQYKRDLGDFAKIHAKKIKVKNEDQVDFGGAEPKLKNRVWIYLGYLVRFRDWVLSKVGEDWLFLALLGIIMAVLSFIMDYIIEKMQEAKIWLYEELAFSVALQYLSWVMYSVLLIMFATGFTHLVSPQAIGSGIPEMKTILRGVVLKEFLTFRTLISKCVGLCSSLGSTLPFGKEGPFVHIASIVANLLGKLSSFKGIYENESRRSEMLAAACAVGVAGTFAAPIGGVLFSIEVTATYFAVRNYWRGFFGAVCGAVTFRLLAFWFSEEETLTAIFKTNLKTDFPFDPLELLVFSFIGIVCGFGGALFILLHRKIILFTRKHKKMSAFLQKNRFIYPGIITVVIASCTFPPGIGQFFAGSLTHRQALDELFSNITWTKGQADDLDDEEIISHWKHPSTNIYINLTIFIVMNFWMGAVCNTLPIPAGVFVPVFTVGAAFGRLIGESMAAWFPTGIKTGDIIHKIVPGGYAVVGAAALSGSVTRTISTSVIVFELTGQISHVLPAVIAVLISNGIANFFQPSFYDSIIRLKRLPYLPNIVSSKIDSWNVYVENIMVKDLKLISFVSTYKELKELLEDSNFRTYPLVDTRDSMILLGSVKRFELERILWLHLSQDQKIFLPLDDEDGLASGLSTPGSSRAPTPPPRVEFIPEVKTKPRFQVSKVDEPDKPKKGKALFRLSRSSSATSLEEISDREREKQTYHTLNLPLRSILKSASTSNTGSFYNMPKSSSYSDFQDFNDDDRHPLFPALSIAGINSHYRRLSKQHVDSIVEDIPFVINKEQLQAMSKKVKLPPEPIKVKNLPADKQQAWEEDQLMKVIDWEGCQIDPAPFQLVERTSLHKVHSLFSLLGLNHAYVTNTGRLVGVVALKELRHAIQGHLDEAAEKKHSSSLSTEIDISDDDELNDPQQLEVVHPREPDGYRLVNRHGTKYEVESDDEVLRTSNV